MLDFIVSIIVIVMALSMLGSWIGRMSVRRNWSFPLMLVVALVLGGFIGNVYFSAVVIPLYNNIGG
ncbi:hypothetical protein pEaSNUABM6_00134 [Erwinia phage pEa_SNUABM_6]|nr:hypothetical protein pEaSNUABM6_00134 [Erwinia phage pEa_SNUABM_6]